LQTLVRLGAYQSLDFTIAQALKQRTADFPGVVTCSPKDSLGAIFSLIKIRRVHRLVVVAGADDPTPGRLVGVISLSDIMRHLIKEQVMAPMEEGAEPQTPPVETSTEATAETPAEPAVETPIETPAETTAETPSA
jgi:CBS domain-containing protein